MQIMSRITLFSSGFVKKDTVGKNLKFLMRPVVAMGNDGLNAHKCASCPPNKELRETANRLEVVMIFYVNVFSVIGWAALLRWTGVE